MASQSLHPNAANCQLSSCLNHNNNYNNKNNNGCTILTGSGNQLNSVNLSMADMLQNQNACSCDGVERDMNSNVAKHYVFPTSLSHSSLGHSHHSSNSGLTCSRTKLLLTEEERQKSTPVARSHSELKSPPPENNLTKSSVLDFTNPTTTISLSLSSFSHTPSSPLSPWSSSVSSTTSPKIDPSFSISSENPSTSVPPSSLSSSSTSPSSFVVVYNVADSTSTLPEQQSTKSDVNELESQVGNDDIAIAMSRSSPKSKSTNNSKKIEIPYYDDPDNKSIFQSKLELLKSYSNAGPRCALPENDNNSNHIVRDKSVSKYSSKYSSEVVNTDTMSHNCDKEITSSMPFGKNKILTPTSKPQSLRHSIESILSSKINDIHNTDTPTGIRGSKSVQWNYGQPQHEIIINKCKEEENNCIGHKSVIGPGEIVQGNISLKTVFKEDTIEDTIRVTDDMISLRKRKSGVNEIDNKYNEDEENCYREERIDTSISSQLFSVDGTVIASNPESNECADISVDEENDNEMYSSDIDVDVEVLDEEEITEDDKAAKELIEEEEYSNALSNDECNPKATSDKADKSAFNINDHLKMLEGLITKENVDHFEKDEFFLAKMNILRSVSKSCKNSPLHKLNIQEVNEKDRETIVANSVKRAASLKQQQVSHSLAPDVFLPRLQKASPSSVFSNCLRRPSQKTYNQPSPMFQHCEYNHRQQPYITHPNNNQHTLLRNTGNKQTLHHQRQQMIFAEERNIKRNIQYVQANLADKLSQLPTIEMSDVCKDSQRSAFKPFAKSMQMRPSRLLTLNGSLLQTNNGVSSSNVFHVQPSLHVPHLPNHLPVGPYDRPLHLETSRCSNIPLSTQKQNILKVIPNTTIITDDPINLDAISLLRLRSSNINNINNINDINNINNSTANRNTSNSSINSNHFQGSIPSSFQNPLLHSHSSRKGPSPETMNLLATAALLRGRQPKVEDLSLETNHKLFPGLPPAVANPPVPSKTHPSHPPRYHCGDCNKTYSTFGGLSKHRQFHCALHVKKEFACKICTKSYSSLGALKMHIRTHTLPCKCHICGKAFSRPWLLQGHVRTHTGEKPFRCSHCGRAFADRSNLRAHLQTHADIKKYACVKCGKTFSRMSLLTKHSDGSCPANINAPSF